MPALLKILFAAIVLIAAPASAEQDRDGYSYVTPSHGSLGKLYMGRPIANIVDINGAHWFDRAEREKEEGTDKLLPMLGLKPADIVADIGAGTGYFTFRLSKLLPKGKVYAVDIQKEMLDIINGRKARGEGKNVVTVMGSEKDPHLPPNSVDLILLVDVYHELLYPREMGQAMVRVLKPGGRIAMVEYRAEDPDVTAANLHKMSALQARAEMAELGLQWMSTDSTTLPQHHQIIFQKR